MLVIRREKCSLALRQSPEAFATLALCVFDECHLIAEPRNRGVLAELVLAQLLALAPEALVVMQSALLKNPEDLKTWLENATGRTCEAIREPWRPTRTLRAVAGFDTPGVETAKEAAARELLAKPARRHLQFDAPLNLLVNLQGAWAEDDPLDYALVHTRLVAPLTASKNEGEVIVDATGYVNKATGALAQGLVEAGHRVLAFIPANKHHNFSVARDIPGFEAVEPTDGAWETIEPLLDLADFELGVPTVLRDLLRKRVAVHTSAMLQQERLASELAYDRGVAQVVFATATLAQGLNLPATAVVIGGINIGFDPDLSATERRAREQAQLLNAVGRAGRPYVAARSLAIVLPNGAWELGLEHQGHLVRSQAAPFLADEDASVALRSQLGPLVDRAVAGELSVEDMGVEGLTAFAFLPLRSDVEESIGILRRSYAIAGRTSASEEQAQTVASALVGLGEAVLASEDAPEWLVEAAYAAGLSLRQLVSMWGRLLELAPTELPIEIRDWAAIVVRVLARMPYDIVREMLSVSYLDGTLMRALAAEESSARHPDAWEVMARLVDGWLAGTSLTELAAVAVRSDAAGKDGRGSGHPLPKIIGLTEQVLIFGLTRAAGGIAVLISMAGERGEAVPWTASDETNRAIEQLSLAVRSGCGTAASLAWWRFGGVRHRRLAHVAARILPPPAEALLSDDACSNWFQGKRDALLDPDFLGESEQLADDERNALVALALLELG